MECFDPSAKEWDEDLQELRSQLFGAGALLVAVMLVGYGEEIPLETDGARIFTAVLILVAMGGVLYFVSQGTAFVLEGQVARVFRKRRMQQNLAELTSHSIVCGARQSALYAARELASVDRAVVLIGDNGDEASRTSSSP